MTELLTEDNIAYGTTLLCCFDGLYEIGIAFYFLKSSSNWLYIAGFGLTCQLLLWIIAAVFVPDSPKLLLKKGKTDRVKVILK